MIHPLLSIQARTQTFLLRHFRLTRHGRYMRKIHNTHLGESCFVIGNGPSLTAADLTALHDNHIDTFAVNRIFKIFPDTPWRPTYYVSTDAVLIRGILDEVNAMPVPDKFIPLQNRYYLGVKVRGAHHFFRNDRRENDPPGGFSLDCADQVNMRGTVTIACVQLAMHMGYRHIYLLGVDHSFDRVVTETGEVVVDPSVRNYFCAGYDDDVKDEVRHDLGTTTRAYRDLRRFCDANGVKVINASRQTKLDVFETASFDEVVAALSGGSGAVSGERGAVSGGTAAPSGGGRREA